MHVWETSVSYLTRMIENVQTDQNRSAREKALVATFMMHGLDATREGGLVRVLTGNTHQKMELSHERVTFWQIFPSRCRFVVCVQVSQNYRFIKRFHMHLKPAEAIYPCRCINMVKCAIRMSGCRIAGRKYAQLSCQPEHQELKTSRSVRREGVVSRQETAAKSLRLKRSCRVAPCGARAAHHRCFQRGWQGENQTLNAFNRKPKIKLVWTETALASAAWRSSHRKLSARKNGGFGLE